MPNQTTETLPRRGAKRRKRLLLAIPVVLLVIVAAVVITHWETWKIMRHPEEIFFRSASEVREALAAAPLTFPVAEDTASRIEYTVAKDTIRAVMEQDGDNVIRLTLDFNLYNVPAGSIDQAKTMANEVLYPYFTTPQFEALALFCVREITQEATMTGLNYTRDFPKIRLTAEGDANTGTCHAVVENLAHLKQ